ncbi:hypothetical protein EYF80_066602 [Liparis tanakae]|uniref:Uncharacterized protein n=1 Tax=Liparis tanakae TaxID=230148 RepID=A0A4Z2E3Z7_9TELE|nr:hypothetical protein EYF80_066602 [Liparis tanakae]
MKEKQVRRRGSRCATPRPSSHSTSSFRPPGSAGSSSCSARKGRLSARRRRPHTTVRYREKPMSDT